MREALQRVPWRPVSEGAPLLVPLLAAGGLVAPFAPPVAAAPLLAAGVVAWAFRDPERRATAQPGRALSPADGRVIHVERTWDDYWQQEMLEVAIFLALWDVHVQRSPVDGRIVHQQRHAGGYKPAMTQAATHGNNQLRTYLQTSHGPCVVTQISGMVARRIVTWAAPGERIEQGERIGMIKFGSQVTLRLPADVRPLVQPRDAVRAGLTTIAEFVPSEAG